jgi:thioredoxin-related protein
MKWMILLVFGLTLSAAKVQAAGVEKGGLTWFYDLNEAHNESVKTNKPIFSFFTGSDWCGWCTMLQKNVFAKIDFIAWAKANVVLLELDFPKKTAQSPELKTQNQNLQQALGVTGYPTIWLFTTTKNAESGAFNLTTIGKLGYPSGAEKGKEEVKFLMEANALLAARKA